MKPRRREGCSNADGGASVAATGGAFSSANAVHAIPSTRQTMVVLMFVLDYIAKSTPVMNVVPRTAAELAAGGLGESWMLLVVTSTCGVSEPQGRMNA